MILIIDKNKKSRDSVREIFHYMGILALAVSPSAAYSEISPSYKAVLILNPEDITDTNDYVEKLRSYCRHIPIFSVSREPYSVAFRSVFDKCFPEGIYSSALAREISEYTRERASSPLGAYTLAGLDAGCDSDKVRHYSMDFGLTKTEAMIVRFLIVCHPGTGKAEDIIRYCFKEQKAPELTAIRTHISLINKKFRRLRGRNLICSVPRLGYKILTPEEILI